MRTVISKNTPRGDQASYVLYYSLNNRQRYTCKYHPTFRVDLGRVCAEFRVLSVATKFKNVMVHPDTAYGQIPPKGAVKAKLYFCHSRNRLTSVCIEHGIFKSRSSNRVVPVAPYKLSATTKETISRGSVVSCANSSDHFYQTTLDGAVCNMASMGALVWCELNSFWWLRLTLVHTQTRNFLGHRPRPSSTHTQPFRPLRPRHSTFGHIYKS